jgi:hypothetical protein
MKNLSRFSAFSLVLLDPSSPQEKIRSLLFPVRSAPLFPTFDEGKKYINEMTSLTGSRFRKERGLLMSSFYAFRD